MKIAITSFILATSVATALASTPGQVCNTKGMINNGSIYGKTSCGAGTLDSLSIFGKGRFSGTTVSNNLAVHGPLSAKNSTFNNVSVYGRADLYKTNLKGNLEVHGHFSAEKIKITGATKVYGYADVDNAQFGNTVSIYGALSADDSQFAKAINLTGNYVKLDDSTAPSITVQESKHPSSYTEYKVKLEGNTVVKGDITFVGPKKGVVYIGSDVKFSGKIVNGTKQS